MTFNLCHLVSQTQLASHSASRPESHCGLILQMAPIVYELIYWLLCYNISADSASLSSLQILLKCYTYGSGFLTQGRGLTNVLTTLNLDQWETEREFLSFFRKPKERLSKNSISAEILKEPKEALSTKRVSFGRNSLILQDWNHSIWVS